MQGCYADMQSGPPNGSLPSNAFQYHIKRMLRTQSSQLQMALVHNTAIDTNMLASLYSSLLLDVLSLSQSFSDSVESNELIDTVASLNNELQSRVHLAIAHSPQYSNPMTLMDQASRFDINCTLPPLSSLVRDPFANFGVAKHVFNVPSFSNQSDLISSKTSDAAQVAQYTPRRSPFDKKAIRILENWLSNHLDNPYPTCAEKERLSVEACLSYTQVSNWFTNARRRKMKNISPVTKQERRPSIGQPSELNKS
ncbi:Homeo-like domain-containing protein [Rozella allomycis CSF55]|uniref:Homeo-like domain-containing protein n=1 Tax=Rozella allomycis (strain CSF55) TaxID=988480 RepID=A0A075B0P1_ROZAC|nr:Homeo-like domain-containing protein [Rozella allomycis CSF55]|eukprot:EPZ36099.1 Homeo-like domain-containing protein [Rozella allomycis CSF55]